ncbi:MAG: hypothetical protein ACTHN3_14260 [Solirubrobacterales bacterium]
MALVIRDLPRDYLVAARRRRAVDAVARIAHELGLQAVTITSVCRVARMAKGTYYDIFDSASDCLFYSFRLAHRELLGPMEETDDAGGGWLARIDFKVAAFYDSIAAHPLLAELCLVHCYGAMDKAADNDYEAVVDKVALLLAATREEDGRDRMPVMEECLARAIVSLGALRTLQGRTDALVAESRPMVALVASSYSAVDDRLTGAEATGNGVASLRWI